MAKVSPDEVYRELFEGEPRIRMSTAVDGIGLSARAKEIAESGEVLCGRIIRPYTLQEGDPEQVAARFYDVLMSHS